MQSQRSLGSGLGSGLGLSSGLSLSVMVLVGVALLLTGLAGCSSTPKSVQLVRADAREAHEMHKPVIIVTSEDDKRPEWTKKTSFEQDGKVYFSGGFLDGSDYSMTVRCANAEALKVACQAISQFIRAEFTGYVQGSNTGGSGVERYVSDGIATFTDSLHIQGIRQKKVYYEEIFSPAVMVSMYNAFVMLEVSKADYLKAKADVLRKLRDRFASEGEVEAKQKAERLLDELKKEVMGEGCGV